MARTRQAYLWIAALLIVGALTYAVLVIGDYVAAKYLAYLYEGFSHSAAEAIITERREKEDLPERARAIAEGFHSVLMPSAIEDSKSLAALANKLGVAPLAPHPKTPLYLCNEGYGLVKYTSDRFGFRNPDRAWDSKVDVVLIGDSFIQGACVAEEDTLSGRLRDQMSVLALGALGNHPVHYAALIKTFIPEIKPRWAVLVFYSNDLNEGTRDSLYYEHYFEHEAHYFDRPNGELQLSKPVSDFYAQTFRRISRGTPPKQGEEIGGKKQSTAWEHFRLQNLTLLAKQVYAASPLDNHLRFSSQLAIDALNQTCAKVGCEPLIVYIPNSSYWRPDPRGPNYAHALCSYASNRHIKCKDMTDALAPLGREAFAIKGPHFSPAGYKIVADQIAQLVKR